MTAAGHGAQERRRDAMNAALTASIEGERLDLVARRLDRRAPPSWKGSSTSPQATMPVRAIDIDLGRLECIDTFGAWLIERLSPPLRYTARPCASSGFRRPIAV